MEGGRVGKGVGSWEERIYRILNLHFSGKMKRNMEEVGGRSLVPVHWASRTQMI